MSRNVLTEDYNHFITREHCDKMRELAYAGETQTEIAEQLPLSITRRSIRYHVNGECSHQAKRCES